MALQNVTKNDTRWPQEATIEQLTALAQQKLGTRFLSVKTYDYSGRLQTEVRSLGIAYDGRRYFKREACYQESVTA